MSLGGSGVSIGGVKIVRVGKNSDGTATKTAVMRWDPFYSRDQTVQMDGKFEVFTYNSEKPDKMGPKNII